MSEPRRRAARNWLAGAGAMAAIVSPAAGQPMPPAATRAPSQSLTPSMPTVPNVPTPVIAATPAPGPQTLSLEAVLAGDTKPIRAGIVWRIYEDRGAGVAPALVAKLNAPTPTTTLPSANYIVHVAYGLASNSKRVTVGGGGVTSERLVLQAGALRLGGAIGDIPIGPNRLNFTIYQPQGTDSEGRMVAANVKSGDLVRLPDGPYHVVSTYGDSNAIMRADLRVERGKVTDATLNHRAATVTLKLVTGPNGEALAGTAFSVLTPGGDVIREAIGSFPTVTLAEGEYILIARHNGKVYTREFKVESGLDRDIEVTTG